MIAAQGRDDAVDKDVPAYRRLRANALQPPTTVGAADRERYAQSETDVTGLPYEGATWNEGDDS